VLTGCEPSESWWKGYLQDDATKTEGVFPSNFVEKQAAAAAPPPEPEPEPEPEEGKKKKRFGLF
jgi:hypothetical protein